MADSAEDQLSIVRQLRKQLSSANAEIAALKHGGGGGTSGGMEPAVPLKEYVDARDDAVESRLDGKLDKLATKGTIWAAMATALGLIFAAWALAGDRFDAGMSVSPAIGQMQVQQAATDQRQDAKLTRMDRKLDVLITQTAVKQQAPAQR